MNLSKGVSDNCWVHAVMVFRTTAWPSQRVASPRLA